MRALNALPCVFVISCRYGRELTAVLKTSGIETVLANTGGLSLPTLCGAYFNRTSCPVVVVDGRGDAAASLDILEHVSELMGGRAGALIILLGSKESHWLAQALSAGATHFLISPFKATELVETIRFASTLVERYRTTQQTNREALNKEDMPYWRYDTSSGLVTLSPALARFLNYSEAELSVGPDILLNLVEPNEHHRVVDEFTRAAKAGGGLVQHSLKNTKGAGRRILHHVELMRHNDGKIAAIHGKVEDIQDRLDARMDVDTLTGLANQSYARFLVHDFLKTRNDIDPACVLLMISVSRFEQINAAFGRDIAEKLLQAVARRLKRETLRSSLAPQVYTLCRLGGAEFGVLLSGPMALNDTIQLAQGVGDSFERPFLVDGKVVHLVCRMGIATAEADLGSPDIVFQRASAALARAKTAEPNGFHVYAHGDLQPPALMANLQADLRQALTTDRLSIVFQPQVEIATNRITGAEALVRWDHPEFGWVAPEMLLSVAQNAEILMRFDKEILRRTLSLMASWSEPLLRTIGISVNVSAGRLCREQFDQLVLNELRAFGIRPERLTIEVTETSLVENLEAATATLSKLREHGVKVAIDDFGTGYSSLAYLKSLPIDYLKVDRHFITDLAGPGRDRLVVHGLVELARSLGIPVIAEGVETEQQLEQLVREGCNWYQGYLCSRPLHADELAAFTANWNNRMAFDRESLLH